MIVVVVLGAAVWLTGGHYARMETARGYLAPAHGLSKIYASRPGVLTALLVKDGDYVRRGQKLAVVRVEVAASSGKMASEQQLSSIDQEMLFAKRQVGLAKSKTANEATRLDGVATGLRMQSGKLADQVALQQQIVASMTQSFTQLEPAVAKGYISKVEYERRRQALLSAKEDLARLEQQSSIVDADITRTSRERDQALLAGSSEETNARAALENLNQQRSKVAADDGYSIEAPISGRVTSLQTGLGRSVNELRPLMIVMAADDELEANLFVSSRSIGFVKRGQEVRLLYDAFPYQHFGSYPARIQTISRVAVAGQEVDAPFQIDEPVYRVTALLQRQDIGAYGRRISLQPGMTLVANIVLERHSFIDWLLDPLRAVSNRN